MFYKHNPYDYQGFIPKKFSRVSFKEDCPVYDLQEHC